MTALSLMRLVPEPGGRIVGGSIMFDGEDLVLKGRDEMSDIRGRDICMILQDPMTSLNPVLSVGDQLVETFRPDGSQSSKSLWDRGVELLRMVRIPAAEIRMRAFPHQMSGGMRQRVVGAIAISRSPKLLIADEPTTSLDATIQLQYLRLLKDIQGGDRSCDHIHHARLRNSRQDVRSCRRDVRCRIVEIADVAELFYNPKHPYTEALLGSVPDLEEASSGLLLSLDSRRSLTTCLQAAASTPRCPYAFERCHEEYPREFTVDDQHIARCWRLDDAGC